MAGKLKEYKRKRDFEKTKEPSGKLSRKRKAKGPIFVIQEHHARRLHYDFRLELDGVLKSWAVPKGPSLDPSIKRLAVQTEDHPLEYATFHGTIPKGEYGGGEVFIWDTGTWESHDADPARALEKGKLEFSVTGKRLRGKFLLVRTKGKGGDKNWLLMKRGKGEELDSSADPWPGFIAPELAKLETTPPVEGGWIHEMKYDGYRMQAHIKNSVVHLYTRNGLDWSNSFPFILKGLGGLKLKDAILDGEIVAPDKDGKSDFQRLQNSLKAKNDRKLRFYIFDLLYLNGQDLREFPLLERKQELEKLLKRSPKNLAYAEHLTEEGEGFFRVACEHKLEGTVSKLAASPYRSGRNGHWVKTKCAQRQEFVIGGWTDPKGGRSGVGSLLLGVYEGNDLRYAGKVGTGLDTRALKEIRTRLGPLALDESPFDLNSPKGKDIHWTSPDLVCEVSFAQWTEDGRLRAPVFKGLREDKRSAQVHEEKTRGPSISSPEKVLFPGDGTKKEDVARYYEFMAPHMLPYMQERPLSLVRCPNGTSGNCFFQKHFVGKIPDSFHTFPIKEGKGEGTYLAIDSVDGLLELTQLNAFEIHAWNCHREDYLRPDQLVMDLDPGEGVPWREVVDAAFEMKEMLEALNLQSFVKLTGGKGLHLHVPFDPLYDWEQVKSFAQTLALELTARHPERFTANMAKRQRKKKIFVDYLRNGYGATAVVPYSLRAKDKAYVALPLDWKELRRVKSPTDYDLKRAMRKVKSRKSDPWAPMLKLRQTIDILEPVRNQKKKKAA